MEKTIAGLADTWSMRLCRGREMQGSTILLGGQRGMTDE